MSRRPNPVPAYRLHKQSGQAIVTLPNGLGGRRDVLLGRYDTPESRAEYARVIAEWEASDRRPVCAITAGVSDLTVNELILQFWPHVEQHYRDTEGNSTGEATNYKHSLKVLRELYGHTRPAEFGPLALRAVRQKMIESGLARTTTNQRVGRIVRMFKWAVENELVPSPVLYALQAVRGLQRGRPVAKETEPVLPVADAVVDATLPHLSVTLRAMVQLQHLTGMRPGEVCRVRACDLETGRQVWDYRPGKHKTAYRGKARVVVIGPNAQAILKPFPTLDTQAATAQTAVLDAFQRQGWPF